MCSICLCGCVNLVISRFDDLEMRNCDDVGMGKLGNSFSVFG